MTIRRTVAFGLLGVSACALGSYGELAFIVRGGRIFPSPGCR